MKIRKKRVNKYKDHAKENFNAELKQDKKEDEYPLGKKL